MFTPANLLSLSRVPLGFFCLAGIVNENPLVFAFGFIITLLTDILDGWFARAQGNASERGSLIDSIGDQVFELIVGVGFLLSGGIPLFYFVIIAVRFFLQVLSIPLLTLYFKSKVRLKKRRRFKVGSAMTMVVYFFLGAGMLVKGNGVAPYQAIHEIVLPYVVIPLSTILEVLSLGVLIPHFLQVIRQRTAKSSKKKIKNTVV